MFTSILGFYTYFSYIICVLPRIVNIPGFYALGFFSSVMENKTTIVQNLKIKGFNIYKEHNII